VATGIRPFRTKPRVAVELVEAARQSKVSFREVVADCFYGDNPAFTQAFDAAGVPFVLALKPRKGTWAPAEAAPTPPEAAGAGVSSVGKVSVSSLGLQ
jgi:SRSO17 transposase